MASLSAVVQPGQGQWTEILCCCICGNIFDENEHEPVNLACGHTACRPCLGKLRINQCPFDQALITVPIEKLPVNSCFLKILKKNSVSKTSESWKLLLDSAEDIAALENCRKCLQSLSLFFRRAQSERGGSVWSNEVSRPMQRRLISLLSSQLMEPEGRIKAVKTSRALGERALTELLLLHQNTNHLSSNLWSAVRARGCQFLGPAMQEEVLKLILLTLSEGALISRKTLVLYIVQTLEKEYPQASKTSVGHVVQLLYRASCFNVVKREGESSLMQLKEELRSYEALRREHDSQVVHIAMESGLRISPDQWSSLLYGDQAHRSHMQSIIDKLQSPQGFGQSIQELVIALQRTGDPGGLSLLIQHLELLASVEVPLEGHGDEISYQYLWGVIEAVQQLLEGQVKFCHTHGSMSNRVSGTRVNRDSESSTSGYPASHVVMNSQFSSSTSPNQMVSECQPAPSNMSRMPVSNNPQFVPYKYKTSMCRDVTSGRRCPRGKNCTFAHSVEEMNEFRKQSQRNVSVVEGAPLNIRKHLASDVQSSRTGLSANQVMLGVHGGPAQNIHHQTAMVQPQAQLPVQPPSPLLLVQQPQQNIGNHFVADQMLYPTVYQHPGFMVPIPHPSLGQFPYWGQFTHGLDVHGPGGMSFVVPAALPQFGDLQAHLTQLRLKRAEINRRLSELNADCDKATGSAENLDDDDPTYQLSYTVATSVLDGWDSESLLNMQPSSTIAHGVVSSLCSSVAHVPFPAMVAYTTDLQPVHITTMKDETLLKKTPPTDVISPMSTIETKDTLTQPVFTPVVQPIQNSPVASFEAVNPGNMAWHLPPMIKGPQLVPAQSAVASGIDRIVELKEKIGGTEGVGIIPPVLSAVEKKQLRVELEIINKNIENMDKQTEENCLIRELEAVNVNINQLEKNV